MDGIPNEILKEVVAVFPELVLDVFNTCFESGGFLVTGKHRGWSFSEKGLNF